jgi:hypothetical protein
MCLNLISCVKLDLGCDGVLQCVAHAGSTALGRLGNDSCAVAAPAPNGKCPPTTTRSMILRDMISVISLLPLLLLLLLPGRASG